MPTYYATVIQIPTPRWSAYKANRFKVDRPQEVPMLIREPGYTWPIGYSP